MEDDAKKFSVAAIIAQAISLFNQLSSPFMDVLYQNSKSPDDFPSKLSFPPFIRPVNGLSRLPNPRRMDLLSRSCGKGKISI